MGLSNKIIALLNFLAILSSIAIITLGIWLASKSDNLCNQYLKWPVLVLGILLLLVSASGFVGAFWYKKGFLRFYLFCMAILIILLLVLLVFAFDVTRPDGSYPVPGRAYKEYRLDGFSSWLRGHVVSSGNWRKIRECLSDSDNCSEMNGEYVLAEQFFVAHLSPIQSGCCKPPTACGFTYSSPTVWINPANPAADTDCYLWGNDPAQLCYNCNACKAGLLGDLRSEWRKANVILIVVVVVLIWVYIIACCALRNVQTEELFSRYKEGWA
ncbi:hypothetical protein MLD38_006899 [Melastoma candidum]|uniref:Uncharacterized protein n=1 Tax=Melastoma candidum TaxID=119954 RepID=A0ACB9RPB4_9MYRT|nr:hypothetical protein MLD38_006899 [Melastoma candidum]